MKRLLLLSVLGLAVTSSLIAMAFRDGEKLIFDVKYGLITAGEATLEVKSSTYQGNEVWYLSTNARTHPFFDPFFQVRDKVESWWDKKTLLPHKFEKTLQEGKYRQNRIHLYDQQSRTTTYKKWSYKSSQWDSEDMELPFTTQDILSAFYYVRNQELVPGRRVNVNITADGRAVNTEVVVHRREKVNSIFGSLNCLVIEPRLKGEGIFKQSGNILIWVSDDNYKIPVKLQSAVTVGSFVATLRDAKNVPYVIKFPKK